jgi:hypothetical protein
VSHLFFECPVLQVFGIQFAGGSTCLLLFSRDWLAHLDQFIALIGSVRSFSSKVSVVWYACVWSIWKARNGKLFHNRPFRVPKLAEIPRNWINIKLNSLDYKISQCCLNPSACLVLI